jgi:hypothetical protein
MDRTAYLIAFGLIFIGVLLIIAGVLFLIRISLEILDERFEKAKNKKIAKKCNSCGRNIPIDVKTCPYCAQEFL